MNTNIRNFTLGIALSFLVVLGLTSAIKSSNGSPGGKTGSSGDGKSCVQCHSGTPQTVANWITTDIPANGYSPLETYTITASLTDGNAVLAGFELTAENQQNMKSGSFINSDDETQVLTSSITHTSQGNSISGGLKSWTFSWTAPAQNTGDITFYAAFNGADGGGNTSGDNIYLSTLSIHENTGAITNISTSIDEKIKIYPLPASETVYISFPDSKTRSISLYDKNGTTIQEKIISTQETDLNISSLKAGQYFIHINTGNSTDVKRIIKN